MTTTQSLTIKIAATLMACALATDSTAATPGDYQGWIWEFGNITEANGDVSEEYCFGLIDISIAADLNWDATGTDNVCWGRTTSSDGRTIDNFDVGTLSFTDPEANIDRSTRPLVSAGGNLREVFGEEVMMGMGQGEERVAVFMSTPSADSLAIVSGHELFDDGFSQERQSFVDVFVKSTAAIRDQRVTADLEGTSWRIAFAAKSLVPEGLIGSVETASATLQNVDLQAAGQCAFAVSSAFPGSTSTADFYVASQFDDNNNLSNRGVQVAADTNNATNCSYEIDADKYLAMTFTTANTDPMNPDSQLQTVRFVVSDDERFLALAPAATGIDDSANLLLIGYRAASAVLPATIDGTYLFNLIVSDFEATGNLSSNSNVGVQEFDQMARGRFVFDSATPGTIPSGETGSWFSCDIDFVGNEFEVEYAGMFSSDSVNAIFDDFTENTSLTSCDYQLLPDGTLNMFVTNVEPGDPEVFEGMFRGYVNDNGEFISLVFASGDPDLVEDSAGEDFGQVIFFVAMEYTGDPNGDADTDGLTNLQEFQLPLPGPDTDGDGVPDNQDAFPNDPGESVDTDGDGIGNNADLDDDGDGVADVDDDFPLGRFDDVPPGAFAFSFVEALARAGVTSGCGNNNYCPGTSVSRAQMAVFLERGINGSGFSPPAATGNVFLDVGASDFAASFIEQLAADGITAGCGNNNYCPDADVTRAQMAVFLLRAKFGSGYSPPAASGVFNDAPLGSFAVAWIEQLAAEGITAGCGGGNYCPDALVTRDQMAVFLVRTFGL